MQETLIKVENVSKKFCTDLKKSLWYGFKDMGTELLGKKNKTNHILRDKEFWAVKNISFEVKRGECLGLIGRNGAGKSTLLKMVNGLIKPDTGRIEMHGKVGALIELGAGFNPVLTGRENIFINAAVLGFSKRETFEKLEAIIDFAEIRDFIDSPVQNYSSGMKVRLGFAIAVQLEPDILLIDEVLAVGDMGFALKCYNKMDELSSKTAMIFVSHSMPQVSRICTDLTVMNQGKPVYQGEGVSEGISFYYNYFEQKIGNYIGSDQAELLEISLSSQNKISSKLETFEISHGDDLNVHIKIKIFQKIFKPQIDIVFYDKEQRNFGVAINFSEMLHLDEAKGILSVTASFPNVQFGRGIFSISIALKEIKNKMIKNIFRIQSAIYFKVISNDLGWVPMNFTPIWHLDNIIDLPFD